MNADIDNLSLYSKHCVQFENPCFALREPPQPAVSRKERQESNAKNAELSATVKNNERLSQIKTFIKIQNSSLWPSSEAFSAAFARKLFTATANLRRLRLMNVDQRSCKQFTIDHAMYLLIYFNVCISQIALNFSHQKNDSYEKDPDS